MIKIDLFSGFLGAGKTTLIKKLIKEAYVGEKIVIIENEFGDIGIDSHFLEEAGIQIREMNSGCICCSLVGDFSEALKKVAMEYQPNRILIEPSGVGKLSDVMSAVEAVAKECDFELNERICVVDAKKQKMYLKNFGEFYNNQIENAKTIILSRTQDMDENILEERIEQLREKNHDALIIATPWEQLSGALMLSEMESKASVVERVLDEHPHHDEHGECEHEHHHDEHGECGHEHHHDEHCECGHEHHHADEVFTSWGSETMHSYDEAELKAILEKLSTSEIYGTVLRAKGIVPSKNQTWLAFDMVPDEDEIRLTSAQVIGRICVIGSKLNKEALKQLFQLQDER